jgi:hypothetical protein
MADEDDDQQTDDSTQEPDDDAPAPEGDGNSEPGGIPQEQVNAIVQDRLEREREQFREELHELGFSDLDEVRELKEQIEERREQELKEKEKYKELLEKKKGEWEEKLSEKEKRLEKLERERRRERVNSRLLSAAQKKGAIDAEQVARLVDDRVDVDDDGNVFVVDGEGGPRLDDDGNRMRPEQLVEEFLSDNEHFREAASGRGAGGQSPPDHEPPARGDLSPEKIKEMSPDEMRAHRDEIIEKLKSGEIEA